MIDLIESISIGKPRSCEDCTKCCEGYLPDNIRGHEMFPGKPCFFAEVGKGCKDYDNRPDIPCKSYSCTWIVNTDVPEEFKPSNTGVIIQFEKIVDIEYLSLVPAPNNPSIELLTWAVIYAKNNNHNLCWRINDKIYWVGSLMFSTSMLEHYGP